MCTISHQQEFVIVMAAFSSKMCVLLQGGSNMTGTECGSFTHKSVPVIFESPCI
jgi:hypothetical protein